MGTGRIAGHLRTVKHWATAWDTDRKQVRTLVKALELATPPGPDLIHRPPPTAVATSSDVQRLWDGGLHPDVAEAISPFLLNSLPLPVTTWIKIAAKGIDLDWLRHISAAGPQAVVWAAHTYSVANPRVTRHFIRAWLDTGLDVALIDRLASGPYQPVHAERLAVGLHTDLQAAVVLLGTWLENGWTPPVDDLIRAYEDTGTPLAAPDLT